MTYYQISKTVFRFILKETEQEILAQYKYTYVHIKAEKILLWVMILL